MKSFLILTLAAFSIQAHAATIAVECLASDVQQLNKFSAVGLIETNSENEAKGILALEVTESGPSKSASDLGSSEISGSSTVIAAGLLGVNEITSLAVATKDSKAHMTLNLGLKGAASSTLLMNGVAYKSECSQKN
ncbi:MAG: hypothetical protein H7256_13735 [Bdellovibrio sp.]|nr:hypothetical protein [Bdellovibrio sp.]